MKSLILSLSAGFLLFAIHGCVPTQEFAAPAWHTDREGLAHHASVNDDVSPPLTQRWQKSFSGSIIGSAVGGNGHVMVGAGDTLYALNPVDGSVNWVYKTDGDIKKSATAYSKNKGNINRVTVVDDEGNLHLVDSDNGQSVWTISDGSGSFNSATNFATNTIFYTKMMPNNTSVLRAVDEPNGNIKWEQNVGNITTSTPLHGFGNIFYGGCQGSIEPFTSYDDMTGNVDWNYTVNDIDNTSICHTNGTIDYDVQTNAQAKLYFGIGDNPAQVKALNPSSGTELWSADLPNFGNVNGFALTQNRPNKYLVVSQGLTLSRIDPSDGSVIWEKSIAQNQSEPNSRSIPQPVIWGDYVFHVTGNNTLKAFTLSNGQEVWSQALGSDTYASPIVGGSTLYIGTTEGTFYAFSP